MEIKPRLFYRVVKIQGRPRPLIVSMESRANRIFVLLGFYRITTRLGGVCKFFALRARDEHHE